MRTLANQLMCLAALALWGVQTRPAAAADQALDPGRLDGVAIDAVETYLNETQHDISLGVGMLPFNSYYNGFGLNGGYTYFFSKSLGWEILSGSYIYTVKTDLTSELAEEYGVNPKKIERVKYLFSTNLAYAFTYGKVLLVDEFIRYFRGELLFGPGMVSTTERSAIAANLGARFVFGIKKSSTWFLEFRDLVTVKGKTDYYPSLNVGMGYGF